MSAVKLAKRVLLFNMMLALLAILLSSGTAAARGLLMEPGTGAFSDLADPKIAARVHTAETYMESMVDNYAVARTALCGNFTKRSRVLVVYMCFERVNTIHNALPPLLLSEGLKGMDFVISQDGGSSYVLDVPIPAELNQLYIRHNASLQPGLHHYFVKLFAFDIMSYEKLIVVEEDNVVHPQALKMLNEMLDLSVNDFQIGVVSINDLDISMLIDESRYASAVIRPPTDVGHLWVFGMHASRYYSIRQHLRDYYDLVKKHDYGHKHEPPLSDAIRALRKSKQMVGEEFLSQDAFFVGSLMIEGYTKRLATLLRLFEPVGWEGMHYKQTAESFFSTFGRGMYRGSITSPAVDITLVPEEMKMLEQSCTDRLDWFYRRILDRENLSAVRNAVARLLDGELNGYELIRETLLSEEHMIKLKHFMQEESMRRQRSRQKHSE